MGLLEDGAVGRGMLAPGHGRVPSTPPELAVTDPFPAACHRASVKTLEAEILFLVLPLAGAGCGRQLGGVGGLERRQTERGKTAVQGEVDRLGCRLGASGLLGNGAGGRGLEKLPGPGGRERDAPAGPAPAGR